MTQKTVRFFLLFALVFSLCAPVTRSQAAPGNAESATNLVSPAGFLNPDGTLNLGANLSGSLNLSGWNVQIDAQRGPVFAPGGNGEPPAPVATAPGEWSSLGGGLQALNDSVNVIAFSGSEVYIGGNFTNANGLPAADYIVKWDGTQWSALGSNGAGDGALQGTVLAIAVSGSEVYVGGGFQNVNNNGTVLTAADRIAKWDGSSWSALGYGSGGNGSLSDWVNAILVSGSEVYVGGMFQDVNNKGVILTAADYIARWDGMNWSGLGNDGAGDGSLSYYASSPVNALAMLGTDLYVGGRFANVNNYGTVLTAADFIARWDGANWHALNSNGAGDGSLNNPVYALAVSGSNLFVGGGFTDVHNGILALPSADRIARWDGSFWYALGTGAGNGSLNEAVNAIAVSGGNVYAGGYFTDVNNKGTVLTAADRVAKFDGSNWSALGSSGYGEGSLNDFVNALAFSGTGLFVGGYFTNVNNNGTGLSAGNYIAIWDGANWSAPAATEPSGVLTDGVWAVAVSGTDVYVGGFFTDVGNGATALTAADYIAKWDGMNWSALGSDGAGNGALNDMVEAIAVSGSDVYVGGNFTDVNNNGTVIPEADFIAKWNGSSWSALGDNGAGNGSLNYDVKAIALSGANVYAGGTFRDVNNHGTVRTSADYIARWDGTDWYPLLGDGGSEGSLNFTVQAIAVSGSDLYVGGMFWNVNNGGTVLTAADSIVKWDGTSWSALGSDGAGDGSISGEVHAIAIRGANVYIGGDFKDVNNNGTVLAAADYVAKWDGSNWSALGRNAAGNGAITTNFSIGVNALAIVGSDVYVGGYFSDVDNNGDLLTTADHIAKWDGSSWSALSSNGAGDGSLNNQVKALVPSGDMLYVGGYFTDVNNNGMLLAAADSIAAYGLGPKNIYLPMVIKR